MTGLEKLREIGVEKIHDQTHIARKFIEDILNEKYFSMNKIQFAGFISIIERDFNIDLHELIDAYNARMKKESAQQDEPFVVSAQESEKQEKKKGVYIAAALAVAGVVLLIFALSSTVDDMPLEIPVIEISSEVADSEINNSIIEEAKTNLTQLESAPDLIETQELNVTEEPAIEISKFEIIPQSNLWIGIIDLETFARTQKLTSSPFELAADKDWLLVMGHGFVRFDVNGEKIRFEDAKKVWFAYENGKLTKLSRREFKEKNRGKSW